MTLDRIKAIRAALAEAEADEAKERAQRRLRIPVRWKYTLEPNTDRHERVYDPACRLYRLEGRIINKEEARLVGHNIDHSEGGMTYVYNTLSERLVMAVGGGTIFVGHLMGDQNEEDQKVMDQLSHFLVQNPEGGDVTEIVNEYKEKGR